MTTSRRYLIAATNMPRPRVLSLILVGLLCLQTVAFISQAILCAPIQDELGQLAASIATTCTGDPGFYRVNPPLPKVLPGLAVIALRDVPAMPVALPSYMASGNRPLEFTVPKQYKMDSHGDEPSG